MNSFIRIFGFCLSLLLFIVNTSLSQNNLTVKLTESSVLLDRLVVCGDLDYQKVIIGIDGEATGIRRNIIVTLDLFDGIILDRLSSNTSTEGVQLLSSSTPSRPQFSIPDMDEVGLSEVMIGFTVVADCRVVTLIEENNETQVFDVWTLDYELEGQNFSDTFNGVEYKNTIAIPNLSFEITENTEPVQLGIPFQRTVKVINSGLSSYLNEFVYEVRLAPSVRYQELRVGDLSVPFNKTVNADGDTLITAIIDNGFFYANTKESGIEGDGNGRFDVDEVVSIKETLVVSNCGNDGKFNLNTTHQVSWGCGPTNCQVEEATATFNFGVGEEQINFNVGTDTITPGFCTQGTASLIISNTGFEFGDGFGTITNITAGIGFGNGSRFLLSEQGYTITAIQIGDVLVFFADTLTNLNENDNFTLDPDGPGGLEDVDGDGFFDDLRVGESFTITATYQVDCSESAQLNLDENCDNDFRGSFDGKIIYTNPCGTISERNIDNFLRSSNTGSTKEICADPDAFNNNDQFSIVYSGERRQNNFLSCESSDEVRVTISLPDGISISDSSFLEQDTALAVIAIEPSGSDWLLRFDASQLNLNNDYNLHLIFTTNCTEAGFTSFPVQIDYYCPECDCSQMWYCGVLEGTLLHNVGPPCREAVCETGIAITSFDLERTTFGFVDSTFTIPFNPADANKGVALSCDSVQMSLTSVVGQTSLSDSLGIVLSYGNADESTAKIPTFLFAKGTLTIVALDGTTTSCSIDANQTSLDTTNSTLQLKIDWSHCLEGRVLVEGTQLNFSGAFSINPDAPVPNNTFKKVPDLRVEAYATVDGQRFSVCDSYGKIFRLAKLDTKLIGPSNDSQPEGCTNATLLYSLDKSINGNAMREFFGSELRPATQVNKVSITYDPTFVGAFSGWLLEARTQEGLWDTLPDFSQFEPGNYEVLFEDNARLSSMSGANQLFQLRIHAIPECGSAFSGIDGSASYDIAAAVEYEYRYATTASEEDNCVVSQRLVQDKTINYQNPPSFSLEGIEQEVATASTQAQWIIEHCNTSFNADAGATWVAFEMPSDSIQITRVELLYQTGAIDTLAFQAYGTDGNKVFAFTPGLTRNITGNNKDDVCNLLRITADLNTCGTNSIIASTGWNCTAYDEVTWTPDLYPPCSQKAIRLFVTTSTPFLSADYLTESSIIGSLLCDTSTIDIIVRNEEVGNAYNINSQITIPLGSHLVPNSLSFAYPSTADFVQLTTDPLLIREQPDGSSVYEYTDFSLLNNYLHENGLPGFDVSQPDSSEFRLKYRLVSDCDFAIGSINRYRFQGTSVCGLPSNTALAETPPFIFQLDPSIARNFEVSLIDEGAITAGQANTLNLAIRNIGINPSRIDSVTIDLPNTLSYIPNSTLASDNANWDLQEPRLLQDINQQSLRYPLPENMASGESVRLSFQLSATQNACAAPIQINISTLSKVNFFCTVSGEDCLLNFPTSTINSLVFSCDTLAVLDPCEQIIPLVQDTLLAPNCDAFTNYCLPNIAIGELGFINISDNGTPMDLSNSTSCNFQQTGIYSYGNIQNVSGPIEVLSWEVNGLTYADTVANINVLVDSMNVWNPTGNWSLNEASRVIEGGQEGGRYGQLDVSIVETGTRSFLGYDTKISPLGTTVVLSTGIHDLVIDYGDNCIDSVTILVIAQECISCTPANIESVITEKASCNQESGSIAIQVSGNPNDYEFEWSPNLGIEGTSPNIRTGLFAGGYRVTIRNRLDPDCEIEKYIIVENGAEVTATSTTEAAGCLGATGTAILNPADYNYSWSDGGNGAERTDLSAGIYYVTFTDPIAPECPNVLLVEILERNELVANLVVNEYPSCGSSNGTVSINMTGGSGDYLFSFPSASNSQDGLSPGVYTVLITDRQSGCELPFSFVLESRETIEAVIINNITAPTCSGSNDGAVTFDIQYSNEFLFPSDTIITDGVDQYENGQLTAGDYFLYIQDVGGCITTSVPFTIIAPPPIEVEVYKPVDCINPLFIEVTPIDTSLNFSYNWEDLPGTSNEAIRNNLESGTYHLIVSASQNCTTDLAIVLPTCCIPAIVQDLQITNAICGAEDGMVNIILDDQAAIDYTFSFIPDVGVEGATPNIRQNLPVGNYEVAIAYKGNSDCAETINFLVAEEEAEVLIVDRNITAAPCGTSEGAIEIIVDGDVADYTYTYEPDMGAVGGTVNTRTGLSAGDYSVTVALNGSTTCTETIDFIIPEEGSGGVIINRNITAAPCGTNEGAIEIIVNGDAANYSYSYEPDIGIAGSTANTRTELPAGDYAVTVGVNGSATCSETINFIIPEEGGNNFVRDTIITASNCGASDGRIEILVNGDLDNYSFTYEPNLGQLGASTNIMEALPAGDYQVIIAVNGSATCSQVIDFTILEPVSDIVNNTLVRPSDCGTTNGSITLEVNGVVADYTYAWATDAGMPGDTPNSRVNVGIGTYGVTISPVNDPACFQVIEVGVPFGNTGTSPVISDNIINPSCGETNGVVDLTMASDPANYRYQWTPDIGVFGTTENIREALPGGNYQLLIIDKRDTVCVTRINISLVNEEPVANIITNPATCSSVANGSIRLSPATYSYTWADGFVGNERFNILAGDYDLTITDPSATDNCRTAMTVNLPAENIFNVEPIIEVMPSCTLNDGLVKIAIEGGSGDYRFSWEDPDSVANNLGPGIYDVTVTDNRTNCEAVAKFELFNPVLQGLCDTDCIIKKRRDTIVIQTINCLDPQSLCLDYTVDINRPLSLSVDGFVTPIGVADPCLFDSTSTYLYSNLAGQGEVGPYEITAWPVNDTVYAGTFNNIVDLVDSMNRWDPIGDWKISEEGLSIIGNATNNRYQAMQVIAANVGSVDTLAYAVEYTTSGIFTTIDIGFHEVVVSDPATLCSDSILVIVNCNFIDTSTVVFNPGQRDTLCFSTDDLMGGVASINVGCLQNDIVQIEVLNDTCIIMESERPGIDTACVILCDSFGICDTTFLDIQIMPLVIEDSLEVKSMSEACFDAASLGIEGVLNSIEIQASSTDTLLPIVSYVVDTVNGCVSYRANVIGIDTTHIAFCTDLGTCDTIPFMINVRNSSAAQIKDTLFINEIASYCFDVTIFPGAIDNFENICLEASGSEVDFFLNPLTNCVEYTGLDLGRDSACILLCDDFGICDTAFFDVLVVEFKDLPTAVEDLDTAIIGTPLVINILANDTPFGVPDDGISIIDPPLYGEANLNLDGSITYLTDEFCARSDQFTYSICNDIGCDTTTATVWIECIDIVIFTAVSPNRDDRNDFFFISGIEEFPECRLQIYNRWGERVYDVIGYDNKWTGTWKGNKELPDGAYFYCLELNDDEERVFTGYLELHR